MSKRDAAPTLSWVFFGKIYRWFTAIILTILIIFGITIYAIGYSIDRDCSNTYERNISVLGKWVSVQMGSTDSGCPGNPNE